MSRAGTANTLQRLIVFPQSLFSILSTPKSYDLALETTKNMKKMKKINTNTYENESKKQKHCGYIGLPSGTQEDKKVFQKT